CAWRGCCASAARALLWSPWCRCSGSPTRPGRHDPPPRPPPPGRRALSQAPAPRPPPRATPHRPAPPALRRGHGRPPDRFDQRAGPGPLPHGLEPFRFLRSERLRPPRLPPPAAVRVLGARGVLRSDLAPPDVAARDAGLRRAPHRVVALR